MVAAHTLPPRGWRASANDRFKGSFNDWLWGSLALAALLHFAMLALFPSMRIADLTGARPPAELLPPPQERRIPPPPQEIPRPQLPVPGAVDLPVETTLPALDELFRTRPTLPPAPPAEARAAEEVPFTPFTVAPELRAAQRAELQRFLERNYPPALRDAGIGARAVLWVHIDETGAVMATRVVQTSGYAAFDELAQDALRRVRFSPALNRDQRVPVWIQLPIQFQVR